MTTRTSTSSRQPIYGAVPVTDTKLLATAALLRSQWADPSSPNYYYPINGADQQRGIGPLLGRYPGDTYDGDTADEPVRGHPWAVSTANFAELYYQLAKQVTTTGSVPLDNLSAWLFSQIGVNISTTPQQAAANLESHGDQMLQAVVFHSDHFELSEQFDASSGFEKSVSNLSWSYAYSCRRSAPRTPSEEPVPCRDTDPSAAGVPPGRCTIAAIGPGPPPSGAPRPVRPEPRPRRQHSAGAAPASIAVCRKTCSGCTYGSDVGTPAAVPQLGGVFAIGYRDAASSVPGWARR